MVPDTLALLQADLLNLQAVCSLCSVTLDLTSLTSGSPRKSLGQLGMLSDAEAGSMTIKWCRSSGDDQVLQGGLQ